MQMQEPEHQQSEQEWLTNHEYRGYRANNSGSFEPEQLQKIQPQNELSLRARAVWILMIVLSALGFFLALAGIIAAALVLEYANGQQTVLAGGIIGLVSSIGVLLICVAIYVISLVTLTSRAKRRRRWVRVNY